MSLFTSGNVHAVIASCMPPQQLGNGEGTVLCICCMTYITVAP